MTLRVYTDGAVKNGKPGWGFVVLHRNKVLQEACGRVKGSRAFIAMRNVAGEIRAVEEALLWLYRSYEPFSSEPELADAAYRHKLLKVHVVHDYLGCSAWPLGEWQAKNKFTKAYAEFVRDAMAHFELTFEHVRGHSGIKWNDRADELAKAGALK